MNISIAEAQPPFVIFERRAEEDREASLAAGRYVPQDVDFAIITPAGSKDRIERRVSDWFDMLRTQVAEGRFPSAWFDAFRARHAAWVKDEEMPLSGTPIKNWNVPTPAQRRLLSDAAIHTVEQLAEANEEAISMLGMGGRALVARAKDWLAANNSGAGKLAADLEVLREQNRNLTESNKTLIDQVRLLTEQVQQLSAAKSK